MSKRPTPTSSISTRSTAVTSATNDNNATRKRMNDSYNNEEDSTQETTSSTNYYNTKFDKTPTLHVRRAASPVPSEASMASTRSSIFTPSADPIRIHYTRQMTSSSSHEVPDSTRHATTTSSNNKFKYIKSYERTPCWMNGARELQFRLLFYFLYVCFSTGQAQCR
jgi:hypothetical protein